MDLLVRRFSAHQCGDLMITDRGIAYQADESNRIKYDDSYIDRCRAYKSNPERMAQVLDSRNALVNKYLRESQEMLDVGVGAMDFLESRERTCGYDIVPETVNLLKSTGKYSDNFSRFSAFSLWDVLEHMDNPSRFLQRLPKDCVLFVSIPIYPSSKWDGIEKWNHYKPGEHLFYFNHDGFLTFMEMNGFRVIEETSEEIRAGRVDILQWVFKKDRDDFNDMIGHYEEMHQKRYGVSASDHRDQILRCIQMMRKDPKSILDYGCGQAGFGHWFFADGKRKISMYDPAIPAFRDMPQEQFDLVLCCDVMEHIEMRFVDRVLSEILAKSKNAVFTISTKPARAKLPDGRNAHVTLLSAAEWRDWIESYFGAAYLEPTVHEKTVLVRTFA